MPGRQFVGSNGYRYGFNGKENDDEVKGSGNQQDYGMRIYDPRLGKFLSVDPLSSSFSYYSSYQYAGNKPIKCIDLDGLEEIVPNLPTAGSLIEVKKAPEVVVIKIVQVSKVTVGAQVSEEISGVEGFSLVPFAFTLGSITTTTTFTLTDGELTSKSTEVDYDYLFNGEGLEVTNKVSVSASGIEVSAEQSFITNPSGYGYQKDKYYSEIGASIPFISKGDHQAGIETKVAWQDGKIETQTTISSSAEASCIIGIEQDINISFQIISSPNYEPSTVPVDAVPLPVIKSVEIPEKK